MKRFSHSITMVDVQLPPIKRLRTNDGGGAVTAYQGEDATNENSIRTSSLSAPTLRLSGHTGSVYSLKYSPSGETLCSTSFDKTCLLWSHSNNYENFNVLKHKNAVLDCAWCDDETVATASADKTLCLWDIETGTRLRKWAEHTGILNACDSSNSISDVTSVVSASDDGTCLLWDRRQKYSSGTLPSDYPVTAVALTDTQVFTGGIDNMIYCWDKRLLRKVYGVKGHTDTITALAVHPEQSHLLSNSMDHSLRIWDIQNFVGGGGTAGTKNAQRHVKTFVGHKHNAEKGLLKCGWSASSAGATMVTAGSADRMVHIWDEFSTEELYMLPGHKGCVNAAVFHPNENVVASGSSDKQIFVGELS